MTPHRNTPVVFEGIRYSVLLLVGICLWSPRQAAAAEPTPGLSVGPGAKAGELQVKVIPVKTTAIGLLEVVDPRNGRALKTLHAGRFDKEQIVPLSKDPLVPAGKYKVRYREGISLAFDVALAPPTKSKRWVNPVDLALTEKSIFVLDAGLPPPAAGAAPPAQGGEEIDNPFMCKFSAKDGTPDQNFGSGGLVELPKDVWLSKSIVVDEEDCIYIAANAQHSVYLFDASGELQKGGAIGGWDNDPLGPKCTACPNTLALGPNKKIYIPCNGYDGAIRAYDRTQSGFRGFLYKGGLAPSQCLVDRYMSVDPVSGILYRFDTFGRLMAYTDTGKDFTLSKAVPPSMLPPVACPVGPSAHSGLIWVAARGGVDFYGSASFWGLNNATILYWDDGRKIRFIGRFGKPGAAPDQAEFINLVSMFQSPDHLTLWAVEDGLENLAGEPPNRRVRRFKITSAASAEAEATIAN
jgi:hypothetical protein